VPELFQKFHFGGSITWSNSATD